MRYKKYYRYIKYTEQFKVNLSIIKTLKKYSV